MADWKLAPIEAKFADLIWASAPLSSSELVQICQRELSWKKSTTYTVLRRLCDRGLFANEGGRVQALMTKEEFQSLASEEFVNDRFDGSLPALFAAFGRRQKLSQKDLEAIEQMIQSMKE